MELIKELGLVPINGCGWVCGGMQGTKTPIKFTGVHTYAGQAWENICTIQSTLANIQNPRFRVKVDLGVYLKNPNTVMYNAKFRLRVGAVGAAGTTSMVFELDRHAPGDARLTYITPMSFLPVNNLVHITLDPWDFVEYYSPTLNRYTGFEMYSGSSVTVYLVS